MRILLVGGGGREHALARKISASPLLTKLLLWPGNPLSRRVAPAMDLAPNATHGELAEACRAHRIDAVVCGPEQPLADGLADALEAAGFPVFGPRAAAAALESSKHFAKDVMTAAGVPTARHATVTSLEACRAAAQGFMRDGAPAVIKASGLAAGKGVFVCHTCQDLDAALARLATPAMRKSADTIVVEEFLVGRECSYFVFLGEAAPVRLGFAVDYKRLTDGDAGPNTGGMGCYAPVPWLPETAGDDVDRLVVRPLLAELARRQISYRGCLYVGLMWSVAGPRVVEFNVRLGDPEAEVLSLQDDRDWLAMMMRQVGRLPASTVVPPLDERRRAVTVILASAGYPYGERPETPVEIGGDLLSDGKPSRDLGPLAAGPVVFGASVRAAGGSDVQGNVMTGSGRVFAVTAAGSSFEAARALAYTRVAEISARWPECQYRRDIGAGI